MKRTILIVDDQAINRRILGNMLNADYDTLEAADGGEALDILNSKYQTVSAVLLDIFMPVLNGYEVLHKIRSTASLSDMPVIMITGTDDEEARIKALTLGANDFVMKPYSGEIIKHCLQNNIAFRETSATADAMQRDRLTGIYNRDAFFEKANEMILAREPGYYIISCFDIDNFKLFNGQFGTEEGDRILCEIARTVEADMKSVGGIAGRIGGDHFAALLPAHSKDMSITNIVRQNRMAFSAKQAIVFSVGRYLISDLTLPAHVLYDRANIAKQSVKGRYDKHIAYFDDVMLEQLLRTQRLVNDVDAAISEHQFEVWYQPQYNHSSKALVGAEALVRWRHPEKGLISPAEFIPIFEGNGFIYDMDKFVWREVCKHLRKWLDEGRSSIPVSVNISRYDVFRPEMTDVILGLMEEYHLPRELLRLEITESAFSQSAEQIITVVKGLRDHGFIVEIDDFGSGYSSLNTLKDVPAQIIKLDMKFLQSSDDSQRGGNIMESIVRMAKWLDMSVIAEGVETLEQADFLCSIGCNNMQGYLYARPMPAAEYEEFCRGVGKEERLISMKTVENLNNNAFWDPQSMDTLIFNSYVGAACIFEYHREKIELLRANRKFVSLWTTSSMTAEEALKINIQNHLSPQSRALAREYILKSRETGDDCTGEYEFLNTPDGSTVSYFRASFRVIAVAGERMLVYCTCENITPQRKEEEIKRMLLDNLPCGAGVYEFKDNQMSLTYQNASYWEMVGLDGEKFPDPSAMSAVHPEDIPVVMQELLSAMEEKRDVTCNIRLRHLTRGYRRVHLAGRIKQEIDGGLLIYATFTPWD